MVEPPANGSVVRPRVLLAIGELRSGGSENQLTEFVTRTHPDQLDATIVTWRPPRPEAPNEQRTARAGVHRESFGFTQLPRAVRMPLAALHADHLMRTLKPDVVYCWLEQSSLFFCPPARVQRIPLIVARRNVSGARIEHLGAASWAVRRAERMADLVTGNSEAVIEAALRRGIAADRLRLVPNGHAAMPALQPPEDPPVLLGCVARFRPEKGHLRLLDALDLIDTDIPWRVDLAGDGPLLPTVEREVEARGLTDRVRFIGSTHDIRSFWRDHHVAVLLSDSEGLPNALIEAAFAGRPLVATDAGGSHEVVAPAGGLLVPVDDRRATATALQRLIQSRDLRRQLGDQAHAQVSERFAMERCIEGHLAVIREVLHESAVDLPTARRAPLPTG